MLMEPAYNGTNLVTAGIDPASVRALHVRVSEHLDPLTTRGHRKRGLFIGTVDSFEEVARLLDRYQVRFAVVDAAPEGRLASGLAELFPGRVYLARYTTQLDPLVLESERRTVSVQRVKAIDAMIEQMRSLQNLLPGDLPGDYVEHMISVRRRVQKDEYDRHTVTYERIGEDDYFHAEVYDFLATEAAMIRLYVDATLERDGELISYADQLEFRRSDVADLDSMEYRPGPGGADDFSTGYDDGEFD